MHQDVLFFGDQFIPNLAVRIRDLQADLAFGFFAERHGTSDLGEHALVFGRAGFEQFGHTGQTAGNVSGLLTFDRDTCQHFARAHVHAVAHLDQRADLETDGHRVVGARNLDFFALSIDQLDLWTDDLGSATALGVNDHQGRQAGHFVELLGHSQAFFDVLELHGTCVLGDDRTCQWVPVGQDGASLDGLVGLDRQDGTVRHFVTLTLTAVFADDDLTGAGNHHQLAFAVGHITHGGVKTNGTVGFGFHAGGHRRT